MKNKEFWKDYENKKMLKRWAVVISYICVVFNMAFPTVFWSLPIVMGVYFIFSLLPFSPVATRVLVMSVVMKCTWLLLASSVVFNFNGVVTAVLCYGLLTVEGCLYCEKGRWHCSERVKTGKYHALAMTTFATLLGAIRYMVMDYRSIAYMLVCVFISLIMLLIAGVGVKDEVHFALRKYFNRGFDVMDEY